MVNDNKSVTGVAVGRVSQIPVSENEHKVLESVIGNWINEGHIVGTNEKILTSDRYEWIPGKFFVLHKAYGLMGEVEVGGTEIIGYDQEKKEYYSTFYDSQGNINHDSITIKDNTWIWSGQSHRATVEFTENNKKQTVKHEHLDQDGKWILSMEVILRKIE